MNEIPLWPNGAPNTEHETRQHETRQEKESWSVEANPVRFLRNVTKPTLTVFLPDPAIATGTAVVVCPGGALHILAIDHEGFEVARWLSARGIAAFVLKYRVLETPDADADYEAYMQKILADDETMRAFSVKHQPSILADGQQAVKMVRERASEWNINPNRIGMMGFSAGGFVTASVALEHTAESRPDFVAPIYAAIWDDPVVPENAPPMFLALASNDKFGELMIESSLRLYRAWQAAGVSVELHAYAQGEHGFGMRTQGLPSDTWIERFYEWLETQGFTR